MNYSRKLIAAGYGLALLLVLLPLLEPVVTLVPARPRLIAWRLQAVGAISQALILPIAGCVVAVATAVLLRHRGVLRMLAALAGLAAVVLGMVAALFALDLLQYRTVIESDLREFYQLAGAVYFLALMLSAGFFLWLGAAAWRSARTRRRRRRVRLEEAPSGSAAIRAVR